MTQEEHRQRHVELHRAFSELVADWNGHQIYKSNPSNSARHPMQCFMRWSRYQTATPSKIPDSRDDAARHSDASDEEHRQRHIELHRALNELVGDWIWHQFYLGKGGIGNPSIALFMRWSHNQTMAPTLPYSGDQTTGHSDASPEPSGRENGEVQKPGVQERGKHGALGYGKKRKEEQPNSPKL